MDNFIRIRFQLNPSDWHGHATETLWAEPVEGDDLNEVYSLMSSPFFAKGVSFKDKIRARMNIDSDMLEFVSLIEKGGHSNYMIIKTGNYKEFEEFLRLIEHKGCTYESGSIKLCSGQVNIYALDVPPSADIYHVYDILSDGENKGVWMFQEGAVGHILRG